jgi:glycosyltransferase involved in cell wall biosynthesis
MPAFGDMRTPRRYPIEEFILKLQCSAASFIVPGVHDCLTWRLGQSLALGKAIIATPLARTMPAPLEHGQNVHFVDGSEASIQDALQKICGDALYRRQLEREARAYYDRHLAPKAVVGRLLAQL